MELNTYLSMIILNVNGLNERYKVSEWINKQDPSICSLQEIHFRPNNNSKWKMRDGEASIMLQNNRRKLE